MGLQERKQAARALSSPEKIFPFLQFVPRASSYGSLCLGGVGGAVGAQERDPRALDQRGVRRTAFGRSRVNNDLGSITG